MKIFLQYSNIHNNAPSVSEFETVLHAVIRLRQVQTGTMPQKYTHAPFAQLEHFQRWKIVS